LSFRISSSGAIAAFTSARLKKRRSRSRARIQRLTNSTPASTAGLSRGFRGRAGSTAQP